MPTVRVKKVVARRNSGATSDGAMGPPSVASGGAEYVDADMTSTGSELDLATTGDEGGKRFKPGSPKKDAADEAAKPKRELRKRRKAALGRGVSVPELRREEGRDHDIVAPAAGCGSVVVGKVKAITNGLLAVVFGSGVESSVARQLVEHSGRYEELLMSVVAENERLRGRLDVYASRPITSVSSGVVTVPAAPVVTPVATPACAPMALPKPVETWAVVVKGKGRGKEASKEVVKKVVEEVGPTLGVRVHEVRPTRDGGAIIRTPSVAERERVVKNGKFREVGLEVSVEDKLGPRVVVQRVHPEIPIEEFMRDLYEMNLKDRMTRETFDRSIKLVGGPWKKDAGPVNVVLEATNRVTSTLLGVGRCYVKWFSFHVRSYDPVVGCFRCLGFDHRVRDCRYKEDVCRRCGQSGHLASRCDNALHCRNCALKGMPSGHLMLSSGCPTYAMMVARANARH